MGIVYFNFKINYNTNFNLLDKYYPNINTHAEFTLYSKYKIGMNWLSVCFLNSF